MTTRGEIPGILLAIGPRSRETVMKLFTLAYSVITLIVVSTAAFSQEANPNGADRETPTATREDLAWAYLRLERAYFANLPSEDSRIAQINRGFDSATKKFFSGKFAQTIAEVNGLTASLIATDPAKSLAIALSLKPTVDPAVASLDGTQTIQVRLTSIYPVEISDDVGLRLTLKPGDEDRTVFSGLIPIGPDSGTGIDTTIEIEVTPELRAGDYRIFVTDQDQVDVNIGQLNVVASSLDKVRAQNTKRLDAVDSNQPEIVAAKRACQSRNMMLQDQPGSQNSVAFLSNFAELAREIDQEISAIEASKDPYKGRTGDYWRTFGGGDQDKPIPCRVYAPEQVVGEKPMPLVIALHGAGGDENMFFSGYGAGMIKRLADQQGFLVVSPATTAIGGRPERFDTLLAELSNDYAIDPDAVYLIGHSMGAFTTFSVATKRQDKIAAACCLAGGGRSVSGPIPPMLVIAGELDTIIAAAMLKIGAQQAIEAGQPLEFEVENHYGHTLLVGAVLPKAVDWLLKHRRK